ncbi:FIST signal transduction protein [uncultured Clostridium sp.]|uniref:FIST signal transduction protein n=1 Tax=uncultured Clostridium sp. TaxID=59620 RepID=UPI0025E1AF4F|nr:FIST N-terminal domain-containing protein [uncultured Clostridium sp.]
MNYEIRRSTKKDMNEAINEISQEINSPKLIIFFCQYECFEECSKKLKANFNNSVIIGSTTFAAFCKEGAYKDNIIALFITDGIECYGDIIENADKYPLKSISRIEKCVSKLRDTDNAICFEVSNAFISCEELVLSVLNSVLKDKNIPLFGGTAGNSAKDDKNLIAFNGKVYLNASAFVIIKNLTGRIKIYKENIYKPTNFHFTATKVDVESRTVYEYDDKPAAEVMAHILNTDINKLPNYFDNYPVGRIIDKDIFITANNQISNKNGISYHARIYKNSSMVLLELDDYKAINDITVNKIKNDDIKPSLAIMINCLARSILFEQNNYLTEFAKKIGNAVDNYIGFSGYGEQYNQYHFNQTMVIAVFE